MPTDLLTPHSCSFRALSLSPSCQRTELDDTVVSHGGITFGGIISGQKMKTARMLQVFSALVNKLRERGVKKLIYKAIPHIYHTLPAEEDLYALFLHNARLFRRDVSSTVAAVQKPPVAKGRKGALRHSHVPGIGGGARGGVLPVHGD